MMCNAGKSYWVLMALFLFAFSSSFQQKKIFNHSLSSSVKLTFINNVKGSKIAFNDSTYTNPFGEKYIITKLKYYITGLSLQNKNQSIKEKNSYHLIDESKSSF